MQRLGRPVGRILHSWRALSPHISTSSKLLSKVPTLDSMDVEQNDFGEGRRFCSLTHEGGKVSKQQEALQATLAEISKTFGAEAVMWLGRDTNKKSIPVISTGSLALDMALGIGGLPKGRIVEIYGPEGSGKTTLSLHVIAEAHKKGAHCAFVDVDGKYDAAFAEDLGIFHKRLTLVQPTNGEQVFLFVDQIVRSGTAEVVVVDSVSSLFPQAESLGESSIALKARLMSQSLRKLTHGLSKNKTLLIFISQTRSKLDAHGYGSQADCSTGGVALKFYSSIRLHVYRTGQQRDCGLSTPGNTTVKVVKNKLAPPFKTAELEIEHGKGISRVHEILDLSLKYGLVTKLGNWHLYNGEKMGSDREDVKNYLRQHRELQETLVHCIKERSVGDSKADCLVE